MIELLQNAWLGWIGFITDGKIVVLLAASILFLWSIYKKVNRKPLVVYVTVMALCCICPVTAAGLMLYQTKFYDYQWIWSMVPMTAVIAWGAVYFLAEAWPDLKWTEWKKGLPVLAMLVAVLILCSGLGVSPVEAGNSVQAREKAAVVLAEVKEQKPAKPVCLWAPQEIMEYAREVDSSVTLIYGRNMWDEWLNAYSYDVYPEEIQHLYQWMEEAAESGYAEGLDQWLGSGLEAGANCILLPGNLRENGVLRMAERLQLRVVKLTDYYLLMK